MIFPIHARTFITTLIPFPFKEYSIFLRPLRKKTGYSSPPILYFSSILSPPLRLNILIHYPNFARNFKYILPQAAYIVCFRLSFLPFRRSLKPAISFLTAYLFHFHLAFLHPGIAPLPLTSSPFPSTSAPTLFTFTVKRVFPHSVPCRFSPIRFTTRTQSPANNRLFAQILVSFPLFDLLGFHLFFVIFIGQAAIFIEHPFRHFDLVALSHRSTHLTRRIHKSQFPIA